MKTPTIALINQELKDAFALAGSQEGVQDPIIIAKFFNPSGGGTWYAINYDSASNTCFGYVTGLGYDELGYFSIDEMEAIQAPPFGLRIERNLYFTSCRLSEISNKPS